LEGIDQKSMPMENIAPVTSKKLKRTIFNCILTIDNPNSTENSCSKSVVIIY